MYCKKGAYLCRTGKRCCKAFSGNATPRQQHLFAIHLVPARRNFLLLCLLLWALHGTSWHRLLLRPSWAQSTHPVLLMRGSIPRKGLTAQWLQQFASSTEVSTLFATNCSLYKGTIPHRTLPLCYLAISTRSATLWKNGNSSPKALSLYRWNHGRERWVYSRRLEGVAHCNIWCKECEV